MSGTSSTLQGSASRAVVKDLSDADRAVNRLKQTEDAALLIHAIPLVDLRAVSVSDAALDQHVSPVMSAMSWSSHEVKRIVSASLAGELDKGEWTTGVLESSICQDYLSTLVASTKIDTIACGTHGNNATLLRLLRDGILSTVVFGHRHAGWNTCHHRASLYFRSRDIFGLCVGETVAVSRHCHFCKRFRDGRSTLEKWVDKCVSMSVFFCLVHFSMDCTAREFVVTTHHTLALLCGCSVASVCVALW